MEDMKKKRKKEYNLRYQAKKKQELEQLKQILEKKEEIKEISEEITKEKKYIEPINKKECQNTQQPLLPQQTSSPSPIQTMIMNAGQQILTTLILGTITLIPRLLTGGTRRSQQPSQQPREDLNTEFTMQHATLNSLSYS